MTALCRVCGRDVYVKDGYLVRHDATIGSKEWAKGEPCPGTWANPVLARGKEDATSD